MHGSRPEKMNADSIPKLLLVLLILAVFVLLFLKLFRTMAPLSLLRITRADRRWLRRNKMWPYYILFALFLLIPVAGVIYKIAETADLFRP